MDLIPAIDLKEGQCVRLRQGRMDDATVFSDDPVAMAMQWAERGGRRLHIVDLDGAFAGQPRNRELVGRMVASVPGLPVQLGGGIRSAEIARAYFDVGVERLIVGTRAIEEPAFLDALATAFPGRILLGLDARAGRLATAGWDNTTEGLAADFARGVAHLPLAGIVYTDIDRDGMLEGVNVESTLALARATTLPVIASGGVHQLEDLARLCAAIRADGDVALGGVITGRALYAGTLDLAEGQALLDRLLG
ncbi:MAG: 1-(5-phosphoribosyl)-5-[(5-phosphoribosylamino)methylideneamino]imidazole-4-carboxamide isomerase [Pseudomonadales bacterium]